MGTSSQSFRRFLFHIFSLDVPGVSNIFPPYFSRGNTLHPSPRSVHRGREADFAQASADATGMAAAMEQLRSEHLAAVQEAEALEQRRKEDGIFPGRWRDGSAIEAQGECSTTLANRGYILGLLR